VCVFVCFKGGDREEGDVCECVCVCALGVVEWGIDRGGKAGEE
jgi:hypothetical protein